MRAHLSSLFHIRIIIIIPAARITAPTAAIIGERLCVYSTSGSLTRGYICDIMTVKHIVKKFLKEELL